MRSNRGFLTILCLVNLDVSNSRTWMDCVDSSTLANDGMPRVSSPSAGDNVDSPIMMAEDYDITMHGSTTSLFEEVDPFRVTESPSSVPSFSPSVVPSATPSTVPSHNPSISPTISIEPTSSPTKKPTRSPTSSPTFSVAAEPRNPNDGYFNYDNDSDYGPDKWKRVEIENDFWHTFELKDSKGENECGSGKDQSPIDVCTNPRGSCTETHEMRPKSGDYKMDEGFITKQILPNKLRLVMAPRTGEEPDPPQVDFSSNGKGIIDMTNIDFKFPSEHTVCGKRFDGEMQYWVYHPSRLRFVAVSFFLEASPTNPQNEHLQEVINAFREVFNEDKNKCELKKKMSNAHSFAKPNNRNRMLHAEGNHTLGASTVNGFWGDEAISAEIQHALNTSILENNEGGSLRRRLALKWHPFHPDIQKSVHFWGYSGSFTEPPCTSNSVSWKIMDVPTPISEKQLLQFKQILFNHVDEDCRKTSVHNADGSVARPTQSSSKYYKCTRDNYVSDEERAICGDRGCNRPFGEGLNTYYPPLVDVTGPPTRSPTT